MGRNSGEGLGLRYTYYGRVASAPVRVCVGHRTRAEREKGRAVGGGAAQQGRLYGTPASLQTPTATRKAGNTNGLQKGSRPRKDVSKRPEPLLGTRPGRCQ